MLYSLLHPLYNLLHSTALERKTARSALRERHMAVGVGQGSDWLRVKGKLPLYLNKTLTAKTYYSTQKSISS